MALLIAVLLFVALVASLAAHRVTRMPGAWTDIWLCLDPRGRIVTLIRGTAGCEEMLEGHQFLAVVGGRPVRMVVEHSPLDIYSNEREWSAIDHRHVGWVGQRWVTGQRDRAVTAVNASEWAARRRSPGDR